MVILLAATVPSVPQLSVDAALAVVTLATLAYGVMRGFAALVREAISIYVGLVLAMTFGKPAFDYLQQSAGSGLPVNQMEVQLALLLLPVLVLQFGRHHAKGAHKHNIVITLIVAFLTGMLLISSVLAQLDALTLNRIIEQSNLSSWIYEFKLLWLAAVPIAIAVSTFFHPGAHRRGRHG